jgi:hypothetical protein
MYCTTFRPTCCIHCETVNTCSCYTWPLAQQDSGGGWVDRGGRSRFSTRANNGSTEGGAKALLFKATSYWQLVFPAGHGMSRHGTSRHVAQSTRGQSFSPILIGGEVSERTNRCYRPSLELTDTDVTATSDICSAEALHATRA